MPILLAPWYQDPTEGFTASLTLGSLLGQEILLNLASRQIDSTHPAPNTLNSPSCQEFFSYDAVGLYDGDSLAQTILGSAF